MEQYFKDLVSSPSEGPFRIPSINISRRVGSGAWGIPHGSYSAHASTDATLFSSSLPALRNDNLNSAGSNNFYQSLDDGFPFLSKAHPESTSKLEDIEPHGIGGSLPGEEELFAGMMDDFDLSGLPSKLEDLEDDFFVSGGGMELDADSQEALTFSMSRASISDGSGVNGAVHYGVPNGVGTVVGEHPYGEHPSRTLFVRNINSNVEDSELKDLFEEYGDIRTLYTACKHRGFVMISYYDIRAARTAMRALQNKPLRRRKLDIHFSIPKDNPSEKDVNQGTLVVFNLDASVSNEDLLLLFGAYGEVKEIRETPHKRHHKFIEFYDVRAADAALKALNRCDIAGKRIKLEPSRPGGARRNLMLQLNQELEQDDARSFRLQIGSPATNSPPGTWGQIGSPIGHNPLQAFGNSQGLGTFSPTYSNHLPGLASILPTRVSNTSNISPIGKGQGGMNQLFTNDTSTDREAYQRSNSLPDQKFRASPGPTSSSGESNSNSLGIETLSGAQFLWGSPTPHSEHTNSSVRSTSSTGHPFVSTGRQQNFAYASSGRGSFLGSHHHHVGSAPPGIHLERQFGYLPESPDLSFMRPGVYGDLGVSPNNGSYMMSMGVYGAMSSRVGIPGSMSESGSPHFQMASVPVRTPMFFGNGSFPGLVTGNGGLAEHGRRRIEISDSQMESKKQYQLDLVKIISGEDTRTTLMIKNIPNKYTSKMLLVAIDENHRGTYDFLYLPIDFKNKCNVGYAFINMVSPSYIASFYKDFNGRKWEKFNSEKVASLAYARIQGKAALVTHFQNSSLMNEDRRCRPILFHSEGQDNGDQELYASSNLNICIRHADGSFTGDTLDMEENLDMN